MMTIQNESNAATPWDSCVWSAHEEMIFLRDYLYPAMQKAGLEKKSESMCGITIRSVFLNM